MTWVTPLYTQPPLLIPSSWTAWQCQGVRFRQTEIGIEQLDGFQWWPLATEPSHEKAVAIRQD